MYLLTLASFRTAKLCDIISVGLAVAAAVPQRSSPEEVAKEEEEKEEGEDADMEEEDKNAIEIATPYGLMKGMKVSAADEEGADADDDFNHYRFLGIPYAEAPVDELRFQDPVPVQPWQGVMNATEYGAQCPQPGFFSGTPSEVSGEEDCLFLNVFTPRLPAARRTLKKSSRSSASFIPPQSSLLPVMVYIHGGGFAIGSGEIDPEPLIRKGTVVVTINYRLGPLGFFNGNQGLKDQVQNYTFFRVNMTSLNFEITILYILLCFAHF